MTIPGSLSDVERDVHQHWGPWVQDLMPEELINGWGERSGDGQVWPPGPAELGGLLASTQESKAEEQAQAGGGRRRSWREQKTPWQMPLAGED